MFGGLCYMVDDKMLIGVEKNRRKEWPASIRKTNPKRMKKKGAKPMDFTGRVMKGFLFIDDQHIVARSDMDKDL